MRHVLRDWIVSSMCLLDDHVKDTLPKRGRRMRRPSAKLGSVTRVNYFKTPLTPHKPSLVIFDFRPESDQSIKG